MTEGRHYLVTGGAGFIGSAIADRLTIAGHRITIIDDLSTGSISNVPTDATFVEADLTSDAALAVIPSRPYDAILHLAGQASGEKSFDDPLLDLDANARSTVMLAKWAIEQRIPALIHASSMGVYGNPLELPVAESVDCDPCSWYGASKLAAERALKVARQSGLRTVSLRMFSVYGPGQNLSDLRQGMASIFLSMLRDQQSVDVHGPLDRVRDLVYIDDCVDAWVKALAGDACGAFNVGTGIGTSVGTLIDILIEQLGLPFDTSVTESGPTLGDQRAMIADPSLIARELGWTAQTDLRTGLANMVEWASHV